MRTIQSLLFLGLACAQACASGAAPPADEAMLSEQRQGLESGKVAVIRKTYSPGGMCQLASGQCWTELQLARTGELDLTDSEGSQSSQLTELELAEFREIVDSPLAIELFQAKQWECPSGFDIGSGVLEVTWESGVFTRLTDHATQCLFGGLPAAGLPWSRLGTFFSIIHERHRDCAGVDVDAPLPPSGTLIERRALCR